MKIGFIGDTHGRWNLLKTAMRVLDTDVYIQVGDFGFWPGIVEGLQLDKPLYWIDGNHEHHHMIQQVFDCDKREPQPAPFNKNLIYLPRGTSLEFDGIKFGFIGGAWSIDFWHRTDGVNVFLKEELLGDEHKHILEADFMVTHDVFTDAYENLGLPDPYPIFGVPREKCNTQTQIGLQSVFERVKPKWWIHGHYHTFKRVTLNECDVVSLHAADIDFQNSLFVFDTETRKLSKCTQ